MFEERRFKEVIVGLSSGKQLKVDRVMLYPEFDMQRALTLKAKAQEALGGVASGVGFWGSPEWALGGAAMLGLFESAMSSAQAKKGMGLLKEATSIYNRLKRRGEWIDVTKIAGMSEPVPTGWKSVMVAEREVDLRGLGIMERGRVMQEYKISRHQVEDGVATITGPSNYVHDDEDEFVKIESEGKALALRWKYVESYEAI